MTSDKSLLASLFDLSFSNFITTKVVKVLFALAIVLSAIGGLVLIVSSFANGFLAGIGGIIMAVLLFFVYVIAARIWLELIIVVFRIAENVSIIAQRADPTPAADIPPQTPPPSAGGTVL